MELAPWAEAAGARSGEEEWVEMGGVLAQFVLVCLCTEAQGWNHGWGSLLCVVDRQADRVAGWLKWLPGREVWSVISVMIFMDVSHDKALAELVADQSLFHLQELSISARVKLHTGTLELFALIKF